MRHPAGPQEPRLINPPVSVIACSALTMADGSCCDFCSAFRDHEGFYIGKRSKLFTIMECQHGTVPEGCIRLCSPY
jgi:hypothetical protein